MFGTLWITDRPGASRAPAISFSALFFAPPTWTVPDRGRVNGPSETTRKLPTTVTLVRRPTPFPPALLGWSHGQPDADLHAHRRRRDDAPRRHERDRQDRSPAAGLRRRRRDERAPRGGARDR